MVTALASLYAGVPARGDTAMTGEITLTGLVLPIGGLKEKILAAHRGKVKTVIIPQENEKDLKDIRENILKDVKIKLVDHMDEVLEAAIESDGPVIQSVVIPPPALPMTDELGTNVN